MSDWITVCAKTDLVPQTGVCAKFDEQQVAIFYCQRSESLYALCNYDPFGKAYVMSRGIMGSIEGEPCVASPLYKQHFNLKTGECFEDPTLSLKCFDVRVVDDQVQLSQKAA
ncbi:nitrite reductase small subunit NirD [Vibrio hippocampi]|uniref:Nitrite reductase (NADH) small subunit n=1 Tax=Vibrio hippocampi TaxID=654686 RepID=A0ABM8ZFX0_9VIBR|nr:nitrite reductase small subunit NirD [Vibrio hippocampi]CAH0525542.1 Nitrite reductase (NADH) small subunit [Vibrio hippocampi]